MADRQLTAEQLMNMQVMIVNFCRLDTGKLIDDIDLRQYGFESGEVVTNITVQELCTVHPQIKSLDLTSCKAVSDVGVWAIAKHLVHLHKLNLHGCLNLTNVGVRSLALRCSKMVTLDLSRCPNVDDISLTVIAGGAWRLENVFLRECDRITDNGLCRIAQGQGLSLRVLDLTGCTNVGEFGDRALREVGAQHARRVEDSAFVALAQGCHLRRLLVSGCDNVTKKGFRALFKSAPALEHLQIAGCRKISDAEFELLQGSPLQACLTNLELNRFERLTDRGVGAICKALGGGLICLNLSACPGISDYSSMIIGNLCAKLRSLDLSHCNITDESVHTMSRVSCLTSLKLDGNPKITTRAIISHIGVELEFVQMATQWLGYMPQSNVEQLIAQKEQHVILTRQAVAIQAALRRKFAKRIFWDRYRSRLINVVIPLFQARVRGVVERRRFAATMLAISCHRKATTIQSKWRKYYALHERVRVLKLRRYNAKRAHLTTMVQKRIRGVLARQRALGVRNVMMNTRLREAKVQARHEVAAIVVQRVWRGLNGRQLAEQLARQRADGEDLWDLRDQMARFLQRVVHGKIGRLHARHRRWEIAHWERCWDSARNVQRVYRGHLGRRRFARVYAEWVARKHNAAAVQIARVYRGYRGRLLAAVARALRVLRAKQQFYAAEMQRYMRGCIGRHHFKVQRELETRRLRSVVAALLLQRIFRGHKGRESREIESRLQRLDSQARPLILQLKHLEEERGKLAKLIRRQEDFESRLAENLVQIEREIGQCEWTTAKYMDSSRINNMPQRFLTKFLLVRLKDLLVHESETHKVKFTELQTRRAELRDLDRDITFAQRELIPLTTGVISNVKHERTDALRRRVHERRDAARRVQAVWRRALVRCSLYDAYKEYWVEKLDRDLSDSPFYYNVQSKEVLWQKPLAYMFFGERYV
eukprot:CAMPEP_0173350688 /NCGR_PEP_ID=MMETSP1144-20121109/15044_1 /TAXON_ID=483371 /ORGANISM="non described non described, Strain CCMP2298" /LENGTH=934 /DNA_ID=CAMNT_0014298705 /DNA_START=87 /DNA_END=2892 /DNA_ORIENTATION=-